MPRCVLAYNPTAGRYPSRMLAERAAKVLSGYDWRVHLEQTESAEHITRLAEQAAQDQIDALFVVGGDGSVNKAVAGLIGTETALGVLPAGTTNVWAQELGLPGLSWTRWSALEDSAHRLAKGRVCRVDVGLCNEVPFLLWAGLGLDAFIVHRIEPRSPWQKNFAVVQYAASAAWYASSWHGMNLQVEVDSQKISAHYLLALVTNIHLYAGGLAHLSPYAQLDDGVMDLWLFEGATLGDTVQLAWDLFSGKHTRSQNVRHIPFKNLTLESDSKIYFQLDGEPITEEGPVQVTVRSMEMSILSPLDTPYALFSRAENLEGGS